MKNPPNKFGRFKKSLYLCTRFRKIAIIKVDPLAQSVEHNTFNVGVLGSSPKRITFKNRQMIDYQSLADFLLSQMHHFLIRLTYKLRLLRIVFGGCELPSVGDLIA